MWVSNISGLPLVPTSSYTHLGLLVVEDTPVVQVNLDTVDSILSRPHPLNLISSSVSGTGVRHPVSDIM